MKASIFCYIALLLVLISLSFAQESTQDSGAVILPADAGAVIIPTVPAPQDPGAVIIATTAPIPSSNHNSLGLALGLGLGLGLGLTSIIIVASILIWRTRVQNRKDFENRTKGLRVMVETSTSSTEKV